MVRALCFNAWREQHHETARAVFQVGSTPAQYAHHRLRGDCIHLVLLVLVVSSSFICECKVYLLFPNSVFAGVKAISGQRVVADRRLGNILLLSQLWLGTLYVLFFGRDFTKLI